MTTTTQKVPSRSAEGIITLIIVAALYSIGFYINDTSRLIVIIINLVYVLILFFGPMPIVFRIRKNKSMAQYRKLFDTLDPIQSVETIIGAYKGKSLQCNCYGAVFMNALFLHSWIGKSFISKDKVSALIMSSWIKIPTIYYWNFPVIGAAKIEVRTLRNKKSVAMVYKYLPFVDHLRQLDEKKLLGVMTFRGTELAYFQLELQDGS